MDDIFDNVVGLNGLETPVTVYKKIGEYVGQFESISVVGWVEGVPHVFHVGPLGDLTLSAAILNETALSKIME